jgi:phosphoribosylformylglycinamidine (FGAM) synthase PurS component
MKPMAVYRKKETIAGRRIADESFLIPVCGSPAQMDKIFVMNPMADFIWQRLDGRRSLQAILKAVVENFDVEREQARADLDDLVGRLLANGLIEEVA